jgi:hypothetical protein
MVLCFVAVVVFTTLVCGGLTEPLLTYTQLKVQLSCIQLLGILGDIIALIGMSAIA